LNTPTGLPLPPNIQLFPKVDSIGKWLLKLMLCSHYIQMNDAVAHMKLPLTQLPFLYYFRQPPAMAPKQDLPASLILLGLAGFL
jgi:hypothetical protein